MNSKCLSMTWSLDKKSSAARGKLLRSADHTTMTFYPNNQFSKRMIVLVICIWPGLWNLDKKSSAARGKLLRSADQGCSTRILNTPEEWIFLSFNDLVFGIWIRNLQLRAGNCCGLLSRHSMNLRNVKLFRAVMHDELESAYRITRLTDADWRTLLMPCKMYDIYYLLAVSALCLRRRRQNQIKQINSSFFKLLVFHFFKRMAHQQAIA